VGGHVFDTCVVLDLLAAGVLHVVAHNLSRPGIGHLSAHDDNELAPYRAFGGMRTTAHGSLWVIRSLVDRGFIDPPAGLTALSAMREANSRLPEAECTRLRRELELMSSRGSG